MDEDDLSWLYEGRFSTPQQAEGRMRVTDVTLRRWARAGFIRHVAVGNPVRFLLCDDDLDELAEMLRGAHRPSLALVRAMKRSR